MSRRSTLLVVERGSPTPNDSTRLAPVPPPDAQLSDLAGFLTVHLADIAAIKTQLEHSISSALPSNTTPDVNHVTIAIDKHLHDLQRFLNSHLINVQLLSGSLKKSVDSSVVTDEDEDSKSEILAAQFNAIVVTSTFTAGVVVAYLSLMNALLASNNAIRRPDGYYTVYGLGFLVGFIALGTDLAVSLVACVNHAMAMHYRIHPSKKAQDQQVQIAICCWGQFIGAICGGVSLFLLGLAFIPRMAYLMGAIYVTGLVMSAYNIFKPHPWRRLHRNPIIIYTAASLTFSVLAIPFLATLLDDDAYLILPAVALTILYHVLDLFGTSPWFLWLFVLCGMWGGGVILTALFRGRQWRTYVLGTLGFLECTVLACIALKRRKTA